MWLRRLYKSMYYCHLYFIRRFGIHGWGSIACLNNVHHLPHRSLLSRPPRAPSVTLSPYLLTTVFPPSP